MESQTLLLGFIPEMEAQTVFSIVVGIVVTIGTFWIGYRQTIGAREERLRSANLLLIAAALRRIAVERQVLPVTHYASVSRAVAYRSSVLVSTLNSFEVTLDIALSDILASEFLDLTSKNSIVNIIEESRGSIVVEEKAEQKTYWSFESGVLSVALLGSSALFGSIAYVVTSVGSLDVPSDLIRSVIPYMGIIAVVTGVISYLFSYMSGRRKNVVFNNSFLAKQALRGEE